MQRFARPLLVMTIMLLAACRQQPAATATPDASTATASPALTALPITPSPAQPTHTQTPAHTPTAEATATVTLTPSPSPTHTPATLPVSEQMTFELLAQEGGVVRSVAVAGSRVYVGAGPRVLAVDAANPAAPSVIARSQPLPGAVEALLAVQDGDALRLYAAAGENLVALAHDASGALLVQDTLTLPGWVSSLALGDGLLFAGGAPRDAQYPEGGFIAMAGVQQPEALDLLQTVETPNHTSALAFARGALYSAHLGYTGARLMTTAIEEGQMATPEAVRGIESELYTLHISGDTLLAGGYGALLAFDIATPGAPQPLWQVEEIDDDPLGMVNGIAHVAGELVLSGWYPAGAYIPFRIAYTPPQPLGGAPGLPASNDVVAGGSRLYIAENRQLEIHDISQPGQLAPLGGYEPAFSGVSDLAIGQTATGEDVLYLYDASQYDAEPEALLSYHRLPALELISRYAIEEVESDTQVGQGTRFNLVVDGETVTLSAQSGLYQLDVSNPASPTIIANHPFTAAAMDTNDLVQLDGAFYLAAAGLRPRINAISFADGGATETASFGNVEGSQIRAMTGSGDHLFVTSAAYPDLGWLQTLDLTDGFELASTLALPGYPDAALALAGNLLATTMGSRLALVDVSSPQAPSIVADVLLPGPDANQRPVSDLLFHDDLLFVALYGQEVLALDVADPTHPRLVGSLPLPSTQVAAPVSLGLAGGRLVVASETIGILLYDFERDTAGASDVGDLLIAAVDGAWQVKYDAGWGPRFLGWAPDGGHFAYAVGQGRIQRLLRVGRLCKPPLVFEGPSPTGDTPVIWIDGERFLYQSGQWGRTTLLLGALDGSVRELGRLSGSSGAYDFTQ